MEQQHAGLSSLPFALRGEVLLLGDLLGCVITNLQYNSPHRSAARSAFDRQMHTESTVRLEVGRLP